MSGCAGKFFSMIAFPIIYKYARTSHIVMHPTDSDKHKKLKRQSNRWFVHTLNGYTTSQTVNGYFFYYSVIVHRKPVKQVPCLITELC